MLALKAFLWFLTGLLEMLGFPDHMGKGPALHAWTRYLQCLFCSTDWCPEVQCKQTSKLKVYIGFSKRLEATAQNKNWNELAPSGVPFYSFFKRWKRFPGVILSGLILTGGVACEWLEYFRVYPHIWYSVVSRPWANADHASSTAEHSVPLCCNSRDT